MLRRGLIMLNRQPTNRRRRQVRTGRAGRELLNERASFKLPPVGALAFCEGSLIVMTHERLEARPRPSASASALSELRLEVYLPGVRYGRRLPAEASPRAGGGRASGTGSRSSQVGVAAAVAVSGRGGGAVGGKKACVPQPGTCRLCNIPASARPFVSLLREGDAVSIIPSEGLPEALRKVRRASSAVHAGGALDARARARERKKARKEGESLLRQQILQDRDEGFNPLGKSLGPAAEGLDKTLYRDALFEDSSSLGAPASSDDASPDGGGGAAEHGGAWGGSAAFPRRDSGARALSRGGEGSGPVRSKQLYDILTTPQRAQTGRRREGGGGGDVDSLQLSSFGGSDYEGGADQAWSLSSLPTPPSALPDDSAIARGSKVAGGSRADRWGEDARQHDVSARAPVVMRLDMDDDAAVANVPVIRVKKPKAQAHARLLAETQGLRA